MHPWQAVGVVFRNYRFQSLGVVVVLVGLFAATSAKAVSTVSLAWDPNPDPEAAGYNIYYGGASRDYTNVISVGNTVTADIGGLIEGDTYYFALTAVNSFGEESDYSAETVYIVPGFLTISQGTEPGAPITIHFPVAVQHSYELQVSTDLGDWHSIWEVDGIINGWVQFQPTITGATPQFFRLLMH